MRKNGNAKCGFISKPKKIKHNPRILMILLGFLTASEAKTYNPRTMPVTWMLEMRERYGMVKAKSIHARLVLSLREYDIATFLMKYRIPATFRIWITIERTHLGKGRENT